MSRSRISKKASRFTESVIREMTRLSQKHGAINLAQGFPNFSAPEFIKKAACKAIQDDYNQYAITWGSQNLRNAIAEKYGRYYNLSVDPEKEITICCGATECMIASMLAVVDPSERVVVFEPFYENYGPDTIIAGASPIFTPLNPEKSWTFHYESLRETLSKAQAEGGVRALILNSPNNPTGKVFSLEELGELAELAREFDFYIITDEIYEHIIYDGHRHHPISLLPGMRDRTITISGLSKTFSVTGWRIGHIIAPPDLTNAIRKMHDFITVGAPAPLQEAAAHALRVGEDYYRNLSAHYEERRNFLCELLLNVGFKIWKPSGAYYVMADISGLTDESDVAFVKRLVEDFGVAAVPGSSFYSKPEKGRHIVRFAFCKTMELLEEVAKRLKRLR